MTTGGGENRCRSRGILASSRCGGWCLYAWWQTWRAWQAWVVRSGAWVVGFTIGTGREEGKHDREFATLRKQTKKKKKKTRVKIQKYIGVLEAAFAAGADPIHCLFRGCG